MIYYDAFALFLLMLSMLICGVWLAVVGSGGVRRSHVIDDMVSTDPMDRMTSALLRFCEEMADVGIDVSAIELHKAADADRLRSVLAGSKLMRLTQPATCVPAYARSDPSTWLATIAAVDVIQRREPIPIYD